MRTLLKSAAGRAFLAAGGWRRQHAGRLVILTFHRVRPDGEAAARPMRNLEVAAGDFRALLRWMRERYAPVALGDWVAADRAPDRPSFAVTEPMCSTCLTLRAKNSADSSTPVSTPLARSWVNTVTITVAIITTLELFG